jgi:hypothetical protein
MKKLFVLQYFPIYISILLTQINYIYLQPIFIPFNYNPDADKTTSLTTSSTQLSHSKNCQAASYCDNMEPCSSHGMCYVDLFSYYNMTSSNKKTKCICNIGWKSIEDQEVKCCYEKKQQAIAFLFEFVLGFGTGHWYIGNKALSIVKMIFSITLCVVVWVTAFFTLYKKGDYELKIERKEKRSRVYVWIMIAAICLFYVWQLIDAVLFGINFYKDGRGHELQEW